MQTRGLRCMRWRTILESHDRLVRRGDSLVNTICRNPCMHGIAEVDDNMVPCNLCAVSRTQDSGKNDAPVHCDLQPCTLSRRGESERYRPLGWQHRRGIWHGRRTRGPGLPSWHDGRCRPWPPKQNNGSHQSYYYDQNSGDKAALLPVCWNSYRRTTKLRGLRSHCVRVCGYGGIRTPKRGNNLVAVQPKILSVATCV